MPPQYFTTPRASRPMPTDQEELSRVHEQERRYELMTGTWAHQVEPRLTANLGEQRAVLVLPDLSSNFLLNISQQSACLYDSPFTLSNEAGEVDEMYQRLEAAGFRSIMQRFQALTLALNDYPLVMSWGYQHGTRKELGNVMFRPVAPHLCEAMSNPHDPGQPVLFAEWRVRNLEGKPKWMRDVYDISDVQNPSYRIEWVRSGQVQDMTEEILGETFSGEDYPFRYADGRPFMPVQMYHSRQPFTLWEPHLGKEIVEGTLKLAVLWSSFVAAVQNASFSVRYVVDGEVIGFGTGHDMHGNPFQYHAADATSVLAIRSLVDGVQAQPGEWATPTDVEKLGRAIASDEARLATQAGIDGGDLLRESGDPRSGYALAISQAAKAELQRKYEPQFSVNDRMLLGKVAAIINANTGENIPEEGWQIQYGLLAQQDAAREAVADPTQSARQGFVENQDPE